MSGIYIPDWGKPEICTDCPCFNEYTQCCQVDIMADIDNCPLIPVPDHDGDLIEREWMREAFYRYAKTGGVLYDLADEAPTVIPKDSISEI